MKEEITDYETASETVTRIECDSCGNRYDDRSDDDINILALDAEPQRKSLGEWRDFRSFGSSTSTGRNVRIDAAEVNDYCNACFSGVTGDFCHAEITEDEYKVDEVTETEYYCDLCEDSMGDEPTHVISVNPRIVERGKSSPLVYTSRPNRRADYEEKEHWSPGTVVSVGPGIFERVEFVRDESYDCCADCADEIFDRGSVVTETTGFFTRFFQGTANSFRDFGVLLKDGLRP